MKRPPTAEVLALKRLDEMDEPEVECLLVCGNAPAHGKLDFDRGWVLSVQRWLIDRHGWPEDHMHWVETDFAPYRLLERIRKLEVEHGVEICD